MTSNTNLKIVASVVRVEVYQIDIDVNLNGSTLGHVYLRFNTRFLSFGYNLVIRRIPVRVCQTAKLVLYGACVICSCIHRNES